MLRVKFCKNPECGVPFEYHGTQLYCCLQCRNGSPEYRERHKLKQRKWRAANREREIEIRRRSRAKIKAEKMADPAEYKRWMAEKAAQRKALRHGKAGKS